ncbi:MAG: hypothetical protein J6U92_01210 [Clostridia bacterium]|nr:hypothetical protein [Clostridia bacterium]
MKKEVNFSDTLIYENELCRIPGNIDYLYDEFISWSEEFNLAAKERKKMIIYKLFKSIKIGKGYNVEITLNLDYEQFLNGINKEESIAI